MPTFQGWLSLLLLSGVAQAKNPFDFEGPFYAERHITGGCGAIKEWIKWMAHKDNAKHVIPERWYTFEINGSGGLEKNLNPACDPEIFDPDPKKWGVDEISTNNILERIHNHVPMNGHAAIQRLIPYFYDIALKYMTKHPDQDYPARIKEKLSRLVRYLTIIVDHPQKQKQVFKWDMLPNDRFKDKSTKLIKANLEEMKKLSPEFLQIGTFAKSKEKPREEKEEPKPEKKAPEEKKDEDKKEDDHDESSWWMWILNQVSTLLLQKEFKDCEGLDKGKVYGFIAVIIYALIFCFPCLTKLLCGDVSASFKGITDRMGVTEQEFSCCGVGSAGLVVIGIVAIYYFHEQTGFSPSEPPPPDLGEPPGIAASATKQLGLSVPGPSGHPRGQDPVKIALVIVAIIGVGILLICCLMPSKRPPDIEMGMRMGGPPPGFNGFWPGAAPMY